MGLIPCGCIKIYKIVPSATPDCPDCLAATVSRVLCLNSIDAGDEFSIDVSELNTYPEDTCANREYEILDANELWDLNITSGASSGGDVTVTLDGESFVTTLDGTESTTQVAEKIANNFVDHNGQWVAHSSTTHVYFTRTNTEPSTSSPTFVDTSTTGSEAAFSAINWAATSSFTDDTITADMPTQARSNTDYIIDYKVSCTGTIYSAYGSIAVCAS